MQSKGSETTTRNAPPLARPATRLAPFASADEKIGRIPLFCFPYAGGGASWFRGWSDRRPRTVDVRPIELPGRENRLRDPAFDRLAPLVAALVRDLAPYVQKPFAFFGHSMGAIVTFELARMLRRVAAAQPVHLFIAACQAPHLPPNRPPIHALPRALFVRELARMEGTPAEILQCEELMDLILPTLRADFALCETYAYAPGPPLTCPISVFGGGRDPLVSATDLLAWRQHTVSAFTLRLMDGGHFFGGEEANRVLDAMMADLAVATTRTSNKGGGQ
jgi:medium-chain acyl-[acyl-carrier-protein] hydrolase